MAMGSARGHQSARRNNSHDPSQAPMRYGLTKKEK